LPVEVGIAGAGEVSWRAFLAFCKGMQAAKKAFGKRYKMKAMIPDFIDDCNHGMKGVDLMDQSRKAFQSLRNCFRTWKPRWHFFLDATSSNCFRLSARKPLQALSTNSVVGPDGDKKRRGRDRVPRSWFKV
jgi:hypothetical protein